MYNHNHDHKLDSEESCCCDGATNGTIVGSNLPNIEMEVLKDDKIEKVPLASYQGKWLVLFFYPGDFTFVCPTELQELAGLYSEFQKINAEIVSVSTDSVFVHKAWHDSSPAVKTVTYPMASDHNGALSSFLGIYLEEDGVALRGTFIVSPEGMIKSMEVNDNSIGRSAAELLRKLQAAQYVAEHGGEACPASWKPGEQTLKPGIDLVGKI